MATQAERREATIAAIERAAQRLFAARGFADTTVDDIVSDAGVAKGAFYHHFESKESVFEKVLERTQAALASEIAAAAVKGSSPVARLRLGLRAYIEACERASIRRVLLLDGPAVLGWTRWREIDDEYFGQMTRRTVAAALGPKASAIHVRTVASLIAGAFAEAAMMSAANVVPKTKAKDLAAAMDLLLRGLEFPAVKAPVRRHRRS
jgi:AcrR family transcriptional regulator